MYMEGDKWVMHTFVSHFEYVLLNTFKEIIGYSETIMESVHAEKIVLCFEVGSIMKIDIKSSLNLKIFYKNANVAIHARFMKKNYGL